MGLPKIFKLKSDQQKKRKLYLIDIISTYRPYIKKCIGEGLTVQIVFNSITQAQSFVKVVKENTPYNVSEGAFKHVVDISFGSYASRYITLKNMYEMNIPINVLLWRKKTCPKSSYPMRNWLNKL